MILLPRERIPPNIAVGVVAGIEARGFVFAPPIALALGLKFVMLRKPNKLPGQLSASRSSYLVLLQSLTAPAT